MGEKKPFVEKVQQTKSDTPTPTEESDVPQGSRSLVEFLFSFQQTVGNQLAQRFLGSIGQGIKEHDRRERWKRVFSRMSDAELKQTRFNVTLQWLHNLGDRKNEFDVKVVQEEWERRIQEKRSRALTAPQTVDDAIALLELAREEAVEFSPSDPGRSLEIVSRVEQWFYSLIYERNLYRHFSEYYGDNLFYDDLTHDFSSAIQAHGEVQTIRRKLKLGACRDPSWRSMLRIVESARNDLTLLAEERKRGEAALSGATPTLRLAMFTRLINASWTGGEEETAIIEIIKRTPADQAADLVAALSGEMREGKTYLNELDRVVDMGNNMELHNALSALRLKAMGPEAGAAALQSAPILPWHDVMGFFEDAAVFTVSAGEAGTVKVKYPVSVSWSTDFASEVKHLPFDMFIEGHEYAADQVVVVHDYDSGRFVPVVAAELMGYQHAGVRGFLGHVVTTASFLIPGGPAKTVAGKVATLAFERVLPTTIFLIDENRMNLVKWFPTWGPRMIYFSDLAKVGVGIYGISQFAVAGWKIFSEWREVSRSRRLLELEAADAEAEELARVLEKQAEEICDKADDLRNSEAAADSAEVGEAAVETKPTADMPQSALPPSAPQPQLPPPRPLSPGEAGRAGELSRFAEVERAVPPRFSSLLTRAERIRIYGMIERGELKLSEFADMLGPRGAEQVYFRTDYGARWIDHVFKEGDVVVLRESKNVSDFAVTSKISSQLEKDLFLLEKHPEARVSWRISGNGHISEEAYDLLEATRERTGGRFSFQLQDSAVPNFNAPVTPGPTIH